MSVFQLDLDDPLNGNSVNVINGNGDHEMFDYSDDEKIDSKKESEFYKLPHGENNDEIEIEDEFIEGFSANFIGESYITSKEIENFQRKKEILERDINGNGDKNDIDGINVKIRKDLQINESQDFLVEEDYEESNELTPPENFSPVIGQIYRSSFPRPENFKFLSNLKLKSILILIPEEYPSENVEFIKKSNINIFQVGMSGNKEPFVKIPHDLLTKALEIAINPENHPLLIHCNRGKHRTGCLVGCIRRLQKWSLTMILDEYRRFAAPKIRPLDQQFIEMYNDDEIVEKATKNGWIPLNW